MTLTDKLQALGTVFELVGEYEYVAVVAAAEAAYADSGAEASQETRDCEREIDLACTHTATLLASTRTGDTLLDVVSPYWRDLVGMWTHSQTRLHTIWDPVMAVLSRVFSVPLKTAASEFVVVNAEPATPEFTAALHALSAKSPALRLMFIEATDPESVYVAVVANEPALDAMLAPYASANWRGEFRLPDDIVVTEFSVHVLGGVRVFRTPGYVCACDKGVLEVLKSGVNLPRVANSRTRYLRISFALPLTTIPGFRKTVQEFGGVAVSPTTYDVPVRSPDHVCDTLDVVAEAFPDASVFEVVDTLPETVGAYTHPEAHVARILSAEIVGTADSVIAPPSLEDLRGHVITALDVVVEGTGRHQLEHVLATTDIVGHYVVDISADSVLTRFRGRTESPATSTYSMVSQYGYPVLVTKEALE